MQYRLLNGKGAIDLTEEEEEEHTSPNRAESSNHSKSAIGLNTGKSLIPELHLPRPYRPLLSIILPEIPHPADLHPLLKLDPLQRVFIPKPEP